MTLSALILLYTYYTLAWIDIYLAVTQNRRWWKVLNQLLEGAPLLSPVRHDGRDIRNE